MWIFLACYFIWILDSDTTNISNFKVKIQVKVVFSLIVFWYLNQKKKLALAV